MAGSIIGDVSALRWQLPVKTPSDEAQQDRMEAQSIDIGGKLVRDSLPEVPRVAHSSIARGGDHADPEAAPATAFGLSDTDAAGRAAVASALDAQDGSH